MELLSINSDTGKITDPSEKIFLSEVLDKKKEQQQEKIIRKTAQNKANVQIAAEIAKDTSIFDNISINDTHSRTFETAPLLTSQGTHPSPTINSAFCTSLSSVNVNCATVNYLNNSYTQSPLSQRESRSPHLELLSAGPSTANEFGYKNLLQ